MDYSKEAQDAKIAILEKYILDPNKEAFIKTLVPNTASYKYMVTLHDLTNQGTTISADVKEIFKKWKEEPQYLTAETKAILMRKLLTELDQEGSASKKKEIIQFIDRHHGNQLYNMTSIQKPVTFATGDEFKEDKEDKMPSDISKTAAFASLSVESNQQEIYKHPYLLDEKYSTTILPHLDLKKVAKESADQADRILRQIDSFASLKVDFFQNRIYLRLSRSSRPPTRRNRNITPSQRDISTR